MECKNKKSIVSFVLLVVAVLVYFLTKWSIWIPIVLVILAILRFFSRKKCYVCSPLKVDETPVKEEESVSTDTSQTEDTSNEISSEPEPEVEEDEEVKETSDQVESNDDELTDVIQDDDSEVEKAV